MAKGASEVDIAIIGGGATGCALALGLQRQTSYRVALIDAGSAPEIIDDQTAFDQRTIALSNRSIEILAGFGCAIETIITSEIAHIHVSDRGHTGQVRLHAQDYNIAAFGLVVSLSQLGYMLYETLDTDAPNLTYHANTLVEGIEREDSGCHLALNNGETVKSKLIVMADGGRSPWAEKMGIVRQNKDYGQTAITFNLTTSEPHNGWAYERFTDHGPLAFLPLGGCEYGVVWTVPNDAVEHWMGQSDEAVIHHLQSRFGYRCGVITQIGQRSHYPLVLKYVHNPVAHRCVVIGNAAQTLHPIAGQGVNLGFRDVFDLCQLLATDKEDCGHFDLLQQYRQMRADDKALTISLTDTLVSVFSNQYLPFVVGRNIGLIGMNLLPSAKHSFAKTAMGYRNATL